jgi:uncharacterized protein (TIGR02145 family)
LYLKQLYCLLCLILLPVLLTAQTNTDFWFAGPEVTSGHGDQPIYLRLTSFNQTANVTISEPANTPANFPTQNLVILANSTQTVDLTSYKEQIECKPANTKLNFGLHIHSDVPITAYYEEANNLNPEIFTLKGNNAVGTSFVIPSQDTLYNHTPLTPPAYNSFDIVALEDATTVTITPNNTIVGHTAGVPFQVILNKGQTYSAQASGQQGKDHLMGSTVTSDKPVSITVKDDSDQFPGQGCYDLTGDQIVPVNIIGEQYIVVRGYSNNGMNDWVFITAIADNTNISVNGTAVATINSHQSYRYKLLTTDLSSFIQADHPVYVWHLTGYGCEAGSAILPPMNCTGSSQVAFTRTTQYSFELIILTKDGAQGSFTMDGNPAIVTAAMFSPVTGNPAYVYARIDFPVGTLSVGAHILANSQDIFHMGVILTYDAGQSGCSYGYFSDFASLNLGPDQTVCPGTMVTFDAGPNRLSYDWQYNGIPYASGVQTITVVQPGQYTVIVNDHSCMLYDTVNLSNYAAPVPVITGTTEFCAGEWHQLSVQSFTSYQWSTGATTQSINVGSGGIYGVFVTDNNGCQGSASVNVIVHPLPVVSLLQPASTCSNIPPYALTGGTPSGGVYSGPGVNSVTGFFDPASGSGDHPVTYTYTDGFGCVNSDIKTLTVNVAPLVQLAAFSPVCISVPPFALSGGTPAGGTYSGPGVNPSTGIFDPSSGTGPHTIIYTYTDANGCSDFKSKDLLVNPLPVVQLADFVPVCISVPPFALTGGTPPGGSWSGPGVNPSTGFFDPSSGAGPHLITYTFTDANSCTSSATKTLTVNPLPVVQLTPFPSVCIDVPPFLLNEGSPAGGTYSGPGVNSATSVFDPSSGPGVHTIIYTYTNTNNCTNSASGPLTVNPLPVVTLAGFYPVCITAAPFQLTGGVPTGGTYSGQGVDAATGIFTPSVAGSGDHTITYTYTSAQGCTSSAQKIIHVIPLPLPTGTVSGPNPVCEASQNVSYVLSSYDPLATSFNWEISPAAAGTISGSGPVASVSLNDGFSGIISLRFQPVSTCGNGNFSAYTNITVNPNPEVTLQACNDPVTTRGAKPFRLKGGIPPGGVYAVDGTVLPTGILDPSTLNPSPPAHTISYTYTNMFSCAVSKTHSITVNNASNFVCKTTLTDVRDLQTYPTFEIIAGAVHRCWMSVNLNYGTFIQDSQVQSDNCSVEKYCEGNDQGKCTESGGLYQWDELMNYLPPDNAFTEGKQGLCPPEWHVPTEAEWAELETFYQGPGLAGWSLIDLNPLYGFHARTLGVLYQNIFWAFLPPGFTASIFWTSTVSPSSTARVYTHGLNQINASVSKYFSARGNAFPVRCVRD